MESIGYSGSHLPTTAPMVGLGQPLKRQSYACTTGPLQHACITWGRVAPVLGQCQLNWPQHHEDICGEQPVVFPPVIEAVCQGKGQDRERAGQGGEGEGLRGGQRQLLSLYSVLSLHQGA